MKGCSGPSANAALLKTSFWNWSRYFVPQGDKKVGSNLKLISHLLLDFSKNHMPFKCIKKENNLIILLTCCNPILFTFPEDPGFHLSSSKGTQNLLHTYSPPCLYSPLFQHGVFTGCKVLLIFLSSTAVLTFFISGMSSWFLWCVFLLF